MGHVEKNFERFYAPDVGGAPGHDQYLFIHANGLCIVGLAPTHPLLAPAGAGGGGGGDAGGSGGAGAGAAACALSVAFPHATAQLDKVKTTGKRKAQGALWLDPASVIAHVSRGPAAADGGSAEASTSGVGGAPQAAYAARALVAGKLLEQNPRLAGEPGLLGAQPAHAGFLAIIAALPRELADARRSLLTAQAFAERRGVPIEALLA